MEITRYFKELDLTDDLANFLVNPLASHNTEDPKTLNKEVTQPKLKFSLVNSITRLPKDKIAPEEVTKSENSVISSEEREHCGPVVDDTSAKPSRG